MFILSCLAPGVGPRYRSSESKLDQHIHPSIHLLMTMSEHSLREWTVKSPMDTLIPFQMLYADGVERLAAKRLFEAKLGKLDYVYFIHMFLANIFLFRVHPPIQVPDAASLARSSIGSNSSKFSNGSRSIVFISPPITLLDISYFQSNGSQSLVNYPSHLRIPYSNRGWYGYPKPKVCLSWWIRSQPW